MKLELAMLGLVTMTAVGCASSRSRERPLTEPPLRRGMMTLTCPSQVEGTMVTWANVEGGVALVFTTTSPTRVLELRDRVMRMAQAHNEHDGESQMMGARSMMMPAARATVEEIEGGARMVLMPEDVTQLEALRQSAQESAGRMARGECPMAQPMSPTSRMD